MALQVSLKRGDTIGELLLTLTTEVLLAEIARLEDGVGRDVAGKTAFVEGHAGQHSDPAFVAEREKIRFGALIKDVVDDLDGLKQASFDGLQGGIGIVLTDGDAHETDFSAGAKVFDGATPFVRTGPGIRPDVKLLEEDLFDSEVAKALVGALHDVVIGEDLLEGCAGRGGPDSVFGWDFGGDADLAEGLADRLTHQPFTVAVAVGESGVNQSHAELKSALQCMEGLFVVGALPLLPADTPGSETDFADLAFGRA